MTLFGVAADSDISSASQNKKSMAHPKCIKQLNVLRAFRLRRANFLLMSRTACADYEIGRQQHSSRLEEVTAGMRGIRPPVTLSELIICCVYLWRQQQHIADVFYFLYLLQTRSLDRDISKSNSKAAVSPPLLTPLP